MKTNISALFRNPWFYAFAIVTAIFLFLRFVNIENRIIFDWDQENYANQIKALVKQGDITLLGPRTSHANGFYLAPYFTYIMAPFYLLAGLHPTGGTYFIVFYNFLFIAVATYVLTRLFSFKHAILFLAFWGVNFIMINYDIIAWWPVTIPIGVLATFYLLNKTTTTKQWYWWLLLGMNGGLYMNMHFQFIFILLFSVFFNIISFILQKKLNIKGIAIALAGFSIMFIPLVLFDIKNNFLNSSLFFNFFFGSGNESPVVTPTEWTDVLSIFLRPFVMIPRSYTALYTSLAFYWILGIAMVFLGRWTKDTFQKAFYFASAALWVVVPVFFVVYAQKPPEYYFIFLLPFILITLVSLFQKYSLTWVLLPFVIVSAFANTSDIQNQLQDQRFGLAAKDRTVRYIKEHYDPKTFTVSFNVDLGREPGFPYLLSHYGLTKHDLGDPKLPLIEIAIPPDDVTVKLADDIGLKVNPLVKPVQQ